MSNLSAFPYIAERSEGTPGLWNYPFSIISANIAALDSGLTSSSPSGNTFSFLTNIETSGGAHFQYISVGSTPPSYVTSAAVTVEVNSAYSDYLYFIDSSAQKSSYVIGSRAGGLSDGLNIWDASAGTMIASFSKQSIRFFQNVVGPVFDVGGALASTYNAGTFGTGADSKESRIQSAINQGSIDGFKRVYVPASMYPYSASSISFIYPVQMVREGGDWTKYDIQAYGATGNGAVDDSPAINQAIAAAHAVGGGTVYFPAISGIGVSGISMVGKINVTLQAVVGGGLVALARSSLAIPATGGQGAMLGLSGCTTCSILGLRINGSSFSHSGIGMQGCNGCLIQGNEIFATFTPAAGSGAGVMTTSGSHNRYINNFVHDTTGACRGLWIGSVSSGDPEQDPLIQGNVVYNVAATCLGGTASGAAIIGNSLVSCAGSSIALGSNGTPNHYQRTTIQGNICRGALFHGIQSDPQSGGTVFTEDIIVEGNLCEQTNGAGIFCVGARRWVIAGNICRDNNYDNVGATGAGISLDDARFVTISNNICYDSRTGASRTQTHGIYIDGNAGLLQELTLSGNLCRNNLNDGILIVNSAHTINEVALVGNVCSGNSRDGIRIAHAAPGDIARVSAIGNRCSGNQTNQFRNDPTDTILFDEEGGGKYKQTGAASMFSIIGGTGFAGQLHVGAKDCVPFVVSSTGTNRVDLLVNNRSTAAFFATPIGAAGDAFCVGTADNSAVGVFSNTGAAGVKGLVARGVTGQTANLLEIQDSNSVVMASVTSLGQSRWTDGTALAPSISLTSESSLGFYRSGISTLALSYGTLNLATNAVRLSMRTLAASSVTASAAKTNVAVNEVVFTIGGASGASLIIYSGGTAYGFNSAFSAAAS